MEVANPDNGWVKTVESSEPQIIQQARRIITGNIYCTLSTCSLDSIPWVSPVFFAFDSNLNIYWSSAIKSQHSQNLYENSGRVAIAIFDSSPPEGTAEGLYFSGYANELENPNQVKEILELLSARARKKIERKEKDYLDDSPRRIYHFQPQSVWVTGERLPVGNQLVDTKISFSLLDLIPLNAPSAITSVELG